MILRKACLFAFVAAVLVLAATSAGGSSTKTWTTDTFAEFDEGEFEGTVLSSNGEVSVGAAVEKLGLAEDAFVEAVWSTAVADDGTVYAGTGNSGLIYKVSGGKIEKFADLDGFIVSALLALPGGKLVAATIPEAKVFLISSEGEIAAALEFAPPKKEGEEEEKKENGKEEDDPDDPKINFIWSLLSTAGGIYAGTGPEGKLIKIAHDLGSYEVVYDSTEPNILALVADGDGGLFFGSSKEAYLYRLDSSGKVGVYYDFDGKDIRTLRLVGGKLFAGINESSAGGNAQFVSALARAKDEAPVKKEESALAKLTKGKIYSLSPERDVETVFDLGGGFVTDFAVGRGGVIYAATGDSGKIYRVSPPDNSVAVYIDSAEKQVLSLVVSGDELAYYATGGFGELYRVLSKSPEGKRYTSKVFDAGYLANWGTAEVTGSGAPALSLRSGNTKEPDDTWADWVKVDSGKSASGLAGGRYIQFKVGFDGDTTLDKISLHYITRNRPPQVANVKLQIGNDKPGAANLMWQGSDPDGDALSFFLYYRVDGSNWVPLNGGGPIVKKNRVPVAIGEMADGRYKFRVEAADSGSNNSGAVMRSHMDSPEVIIDNTDPVLDNLKIADESGGRKKLTGIAKDNLSGIFAVTFSIDGGEWAFAGPDDGIYDSLREPFTVQLPAGAAGGGSVLLVKIVDRSRNTTVKKLHVAR